MKQTRIYQEFEKLAEVFGIQIIQGKGDFRGGYCLLKKEKVIVLNKLKPIEQRILALSRAFADMDTSKIYIKPAIRELIERMKSASQF